MAGAQENGRGIKSVTQEHQPMAKVRITGWRHGLNKIGLTKTIRVRLGFGIAEAKIYTDRVLEGEEVVLEVHDAASAKVFAHELDALGANAVCDFL